MRVQEGSSTHTPVLLLPSGVVLQASYNLNARKNVERRRQERILKEKWWGLEHKLKILVFLE